MRACSPRHFRAAAVAALALGLIGCFEQPVKETMYLKFLPGSEGVVVGVSIRLAPAEVFENNAAARDRIAALQRDLLDEHDPWSRRFRRLEPTLDRVVWDRAEASITGVTRRAFAEDPQSLRQFFSDTLIGARVSEQGSEREMTLVVGSGSRASRSERDDLREGLGPWIDALASYLRDATELYAFLEENPSTAEEAFQEVFGGGRLGETAPSRGSAGAQAGNPREQAALLAERLQDSMGRVLVVFEVSSNSGVSLQELSSLAYDPFPAALRVQVPGRILEMEGFRSGERGLLEAGGQDLLGSLQSLEGKWIDPDPLLVQYRALEAGKEIDPQAFARRPRRRLAPPSSTELRAAVEKSLSGPQIYRVRWESPQAARQEPGPEDLEWLWSDPGQMSPSGPDSAQP